MGLEERSSSRDDAGGLYFTSSRPHCLSGKLSYPRHPAGVPQVQREAGKVYASRAEEIHRFEIFKTNYEAAIQHNKDTTSTFTRGINQFSDLTQDEFKASYLGLKHVPGTPSNISPKISKDLPASVNWVEEGAVTAVKTQGQCGSCWAFATTEQIESYMKINGGELLELSAQQVTSCTPNVLQCGGSGGCMGSVTQLGFNYLQL